MAAHPSHRALLPNLQPIRFSFQPAQQDDVVLRVETGLKPVAGRGGRQRGRNAHAAEFFSDSVSTVDLSSRSVAGVLSLLPGAPNTREREGERLFNDATICHQSWRSCASCHPDGRVAGPEAGLLREPIRVAAINRDSGNREGAGPRRSLVLDSTGRQPFLRSCPSVHELAGTGGALVGV